MKIWGLIILKNVNILINVDNNNSTLEIANCKLRQFSHKNCLALENPTAFPKLENLKLQILFTGYMHHLLF